MTDTCAIQMKMTTTMLNVLQKPIHGMKTRKSFSFKILEGISQWKYVNLNIVDTQDDIYVTEWTNRIRNVVGHKLVSAEVRTFS